MYETRNFRQVSDLVRAHVREPWQCFWADVIHELEEKQKVRLYARVFFCTGLFPWQVS